MQLVRASLLVMSIFASVFFLIMLSGDCARLGAGGCTVAVVAASVPLGLTLLLLPTIVSVFVLVSSTELMKHHRTIADVLRAQKTQRSMRALRMLSAMKLYARRFNKSTGEDGRPQTPEAGAGGLLSTLAAGSPPATIRASGCRGRGPSGSAGRCCPCAHSR